MSLHNHDILSLITELCRYQTAIVAVDNENIFSRISEELPLRINRYSSKDTYNGWIVPDLWQVHKATISKNGQLLFDGLSHTLGVAVYSKSFQGELDWDELKPHLVTKPELPEAYVYHCLWPYRPWAVDWALSVPYEIYKTFGPGRYQVDLVTTYEQGEMLVGEYTHQGCSDETIVFNAHTCHPHMANDGFGGVAILIRLFQWLQNQDTYYSYRLVLAPEHLGTVFYLRNQTESQLQSFVTGVFAEMPSTGGPIKVTSTFLGNQPLDRIFNNVLTHHSSGFVSVPWRQGAGNDETVWEAPGYEVPFVEMTRSLDLLNPYPEYHTNLDTADTMDVAQLDEFYDVLKRVIYVLEHNAVLYRKFDGLICLSNPQYNLYMERPDPAINKNLADDSEKWGYLVDCLLRYFDGSYSVLDIAEKHGLAFEQLYEYLLKFQQKDLVTFKFKPIERLPISRK